MSIRDFLSTSGPYRAKKIEIIWVIAPLLIAFGAYSLRTGPLQRAFCTKKTSPRCLKDELWAVDRWVVELGGDHVSAKWSDRTQNASAALALGAAIAANLTRATPHIAIGQLAVDSLVLIESALFNTAANEVTRLVFQRPRPEIYQKPKKNGKRHSNYTSFYSGHTSFATTMAMGVYCLFRTKKIRGLKLRLPCWLLFAVAFFTGVLRVIGGQHFVTDVLFAFIAGGIAALVVARAHLGRSG